jgi:hypothetical protein
MSIFTHHLVEALAGQATAALGAREVLVSDIMSHVYRTVPASARAQHGTEQVPDYVVTGNFPVALLLGGKGLPAAPVATTDTHSGRTVIQTGERNVYVEHVETLTMGDTYHSGDTRKK